MSLDDDKLLWKRWFESPTTDSLHALLGYYHQWLAFIARKFYVKYYISSYEIGDYLHWAAIGLIESIKHYKPIDGVQFKSFAFKRIRGEIINQLNKATEEIALYHANRKERQKERINSLVEHHSSEKSFEKLFSITVDMMIGNLLESELESELLIEEESFLGGIYGEELNSNLSGFLMKLAKNEEIVLVYHYFYHLRFSEISEIMQLTKGRVSQIHNEGLCKLRKMLDAPEFEAYL